MVDNLSSQSKLKQKLILTLTNATTAEEVVKLATAIDLSRLDDDDDLELLLDTKVSSMLETASTDDIEKLAKGVRKLRDPETRDRSAPTSTQVGEGSVNKYVTANRVRNSFKSSGPVSFNKQTGVLSYTKPRVGLETYETISDLPSSNVITGSKAIVNEDKRVYIYNGDSWVSFGLIQQ